MSKIKNFYQDIFGEHPFPEDHIFGTFLKAEDQLTNTGVSHRKLTESTDQREFFVDHMEEILTRHHVSSETLKRDKQLRYQAMKQLGYETYQKQIKRFPVNPLTQKGNLAEVFLAEYLLSVGETSLPIYRLRHNTNPDESMKGNDVLAFDLDSEPVRIIVGESKFRTIPSKKAVREIINDLVRSCKGGIPVSLGFVADRLFEMGEEELGSKILKCANLFLLGKLQLDYVGLLMSDTRSADYVNRHTDNAIHRLAVISFGINAPDLFVKSCYKNLEK